MKPMNRIRVASLFFVVAFVFAPLPAHAQGPTRGAGNSLAARLDALELRVAKLEGNITAADLVGTYRVVGLITDLDGGPPASVTMLTVFGTATLAADGTGTLQQAAGAIDLVQGNPWTDHPFFLPAEETAITWDYASGILHISDGTPNLDVNFNVGAGGRVLTLAELSDDNTADLFIVTRLR
jgi:hypothetical protein